MCAAQAHQCLTVLFYLLPILEHYCMPQDEGPTSMDKFNSKASLLYLVSMTTFWILTVAAGGCPPCTRCLSMQSGPLRPQTAAKSSHLECWKPR